MRTTSPQIFLRPMAQPGGSVFGALPSPSVPPPVLGAAPTVSIPQTEITAEQGRFPGLPSDVVIGNILERQKQVSTGATPAGIPALDVGGAAGTTIPTLALPQLLGITEPEARGAARTVNEAIIRRLEGDAAPGGAPGTPPAPAPSPAAPDVNAAAAPPVIGADDPVMRALTDRLNKFLDADPNAVSPQSQAILNAIQRRQDQLTADLRSSREQLVSAIQQRPSALEQYRQFQTEQGIPQLQAEQRRLGELGVATEGRLEELPEEVKQRASQFLVSAPQLTRLTAREAEPIAKVLAQINRARQLGVEDLTLRRQFAGELAKAAGEDADRALQAIETRLGGVEREAQLTQPFFQAEIGARKDFLEAAQRRLENQQKTALDLLKERRQDAENREKNALERLKFAESLEDKKVARREAMEDRKLTRELAAQEKETQREFQSRENALTRDINKTNAEAQRRDREQDNARQLMVTYLSTNKAIPKGVAEKIAPILGIPVNDLINLSKQRLGGGGITFTTEERKLLNGLGSVADVDASLLPQTLQNVLVNVLTKDEAEQFFRAWKSEQDRRGQSIAPELYIREWAQARDLEEAKRKKEIREEVKGGVANPYR
ncbi:MAG: hypothetical protein QME66_05520 [Candidatus Eisenbacteria bacterium]|nr:hypothetical protein [Candidatus Eisenbacteria bacterium]